MSRFWYLVNGSVETYPFGCGCRPKSTVGAACRRRLKWTRRGPVPCSHVSHDFKGIRWGQHVALFWALPVVVSPRTGCKSADGFRHAQHLADPQLILFLIS